LIQGLTEILLQANEGTREKGSEEGLEEAEDEEEEEVGEVDMSESEVKEGKSKFLDFAQV